MADAAVPPLPPGVTFLEHGWMSANSVLFHGPRTVLVDSGHLNALSTTLAGVRAVEGRTPADVDAVWLTHPHSDHAGGTHTFQDTGAEVWAHPETARRVNAWDEHAMWISYADQIHERFSVTRTIDAETDVEINGLTLRPIHIPGHASGMVALYCPDHRFLIAADALWENGFGPLIPFIEGADVFAQQRDTLTRLAVLDVAVVLPGHGPAFTDFAGACARAQDRLAAYERDPTRSARAVMRAYFIHHLFEVGGMPEPDVGGYVSRVPCYREFQRQYFPDDDPARFWSAFVADMVGKGTVRRENGRLLSVGGRA